MAGTIVSDVLQDGAGNSTATTNAIQGSAKAWVNFNGTGNAVRASYNVSSVTISGALITVNMTNALVDANYAVVGMGSYNNALCISSSYSPTTSSFTVIEVGINPNQTNTTAYNMIAVFR
jgi:hypothetical protein